jgi:hypothetical protein
MYFGFPPFREGWDAYLPWVITLTGIIGVVLARHNRLALLLALGVLLYSIPLCLSRGHPLSLPQLVAWRSARGYAIDQAIRRTRYRHRTN